MQLRGKNFQSWGEFDLQVDGLTVVVGPSNLGKSALIRAWKAVVRNLLNANQIRVGSDEMAVEIELDGHKVTATRKRKGSVTYEVDGEQFAKLQGKLPEEVKVLNLGEIEIGSVTLDPIFAPQFGGQFMLEESPVALNQILGAFSSTEKLEGGKRIANSRIGERNSQAKALAVEIREAESRRSRLEALAVRADDIQAVVDDVEPKVRHQEQVIALLDALMRHIEKRDHLNMVISSITLPDTLPVVTASNLVGILNQNIDVRRAHARTEALLEALLVPDMNPVIRNAKISELADTAIVATNRYYLADKAFNAIELCAKQWQLTVASYRKGEALAQAVDAKTSLASSRPQAYLGRLSKGIEEAKGKIEQASSKGGMFASLQILILQKATLERSAAAVKSATSSLDTAQQALVALEAEYKEHEHQKALLAGHKSCPKCGTTIE